jgi:geranylgeranyl reductase family protein
LYAALHLAQRGFAVSVFEEHSTAGDPVHCTGVLAAEAFDEFGISRESILNPLSTATFFGPSGSSIAYTTPTTEALVVDRPVFDRMLCDQAEAAGAVIRVGAKVLDVRVAASGVTISCAEQPPAQARTCILACGASYALQRRLGLGMPRLHLQSAQMELPAANPGTVEVYFGTHVAPKGFAWVVPVVRGVRSFARVGLMCDRDAREHFDRFLSAIRPRWQLGAPDCLQNGLVPRAKMLPLAPIGRSYGPRLLAVGDAAGLVKATTGGGIYYSLLSGRLGAETLAAALAARDLGERAMAEYETRWRAILGDELEAQMQLRRLAHRLTDEDIDDLFELARTDGIMPIVRRTARFNRHRNLILSLLNHPPARRVLMKRLLGWTRTA